MEGLLDWRTFGCKTYNDMKEDGYFDTALNKKVVEARTNAVR